MWTRAQLKANAKYAMRGRYGKCLLASLAADAIPVLYSLLITIVTYATIIPLYIQIFQEPDSGMEEVIVGVVGVLQFEVLEYRLKNEYGVEVRREGLPYQYLRWIENQDIDVKALDLTSDTRRVQDLRGRPLLLFTSSWGIDWALDHNKDLQLSEFGRGM